MRELPQKPCLRPGCSNVLTMRKGQGAKNFSRRKYCSVECNNIVTHGAHGDERPSKVCERPGCGTLIVKPKNRSKAEWARVHFCSDACRRLGSAPPTKVCEGCGGTYERPPGMRTHIWQARRYCSANWVHCPAADQIRATHRKDRRVPPPVKEAAPRLRKVCRCAGCPAEIVQRPGESRAHFERRHYHSDECRKTDMAPIRAAHASRLNEARRSPPKPKSTRRKGNTQPRANRIAPAAGAAERAADLLRRHAPVWPERVERPGSTMWIVGGLRVTEEQMIERAQRMRAA